MSKIKKDGFLDNWRNKMSLLSRIFSCKPARLSRELQELAGKEVFMFLDLPTVISGRAYGDEIRLTDGMKAYGRLSSEQHPKSGFAHFDNITYMHSYWGSGDPREITSGEGAIESKYIISMSEKDPNCNKGEYKF